MAERPGIMIYKDIIPAVRMMDDVKAGKLFKAILSSDAEEPDFSGDSALQMAWALISPRIRADAVKYQSISEKRRVAGQKGAIASKCQQLQANSEQIQINSTQNNSNQLRADTTKAPDAPILPPPSLIDVKDFFSFAKLRGNPEQFYNHYSATGWMQGGSRITNWKSKAMEWSSREHTEHKSNITESGGEIWSL